MKKDETLRSLQQKKREVIEFYNCKVDAGSVKRVMKKEKPKLEEGREGRVRVVSSSRHKKKLNNHFACSTRHSLLTLRRRDEILATLWNRVDADAHERKILAARNGRVLNDFLTKWALYLSEDPDNSMFDEDRISKKLARAARKDPEVLWLYKTFLKKRSFSRGAAHYPSTLRKTMPRWPFQPGDLAVLTKFMGSLKGHECTDPIADKNFKKSPSTALLSDEEQYLERVIVNFRSNVKNDETLSRAQKVMLFEFSVHINFANVILDSSMDGARKRKALLGEITRLMKPLSGGGDKMISEKKVLQFLQKPGNLTPKQIVNTETLAPWTANDGVGDLWAKGIYDDDDFTSSRRRVLGPPKRMQEPDLVDYIEEDDDD